MAKKKQKGIGAMSSREAQEWVDVADSAYSKRMTQDIIRGGKKLVIISVGGLAAFIIGRKLWKKWQAEKYDREGANAIKALDVANDAKFTNAEARMLANSLYDAMKGNGTDEKTIERIIDSITTKSDMNQIIKAFGTRPYATNGAPMWSWLPSSPLNLVGWLRKECTKKLLTKIEQKLSSFGIYI